MVAQRCVARQHHSHAGVWNAIAGAEHVDPRHEVESHTSVGGYHEVATPRWVGQDGGVHQRWVAVKHEVSRAV
eukprot:CAMPEP_0180539538 /NCGR_PEP_ID=MMETSP1036_2-20121128/66954_1 /TAXON_ID=632150 /ORGANISM="Azadinium spinosum, Strain 3D9" /LENGTH=72 /DNA_ID=CAMNT_0022554309 /DNA_START=29 /DNA_END=247 /DNA_ORIENTATION=+